MSVLAIASRELRSVFSSVVGWMVLGAYLLIAGVFWTLSMAAYVEYSQQVVVSPYLAGQIDMTDFLIAPYFGSTAVLFLFICPALSMRLFAPEISNRTLELLLTSPVSSAEIVLGKFLGAVGYLTVMLLATLPYPLMLRQLGNPDMGAFAAGYLGSLLLASALVAMGMLASSLTRSQIVAYMLGFAGALFLWVVPGLDALFPEGWQELPRQLAAVTHAQDLFRGAVRLSDLVYFAAFIGFFLFCTHQRVEAHRWS